MGRRCQFFVKIPDFPNKLGRRCNKIRKLIVSKIFSLKSASSTQINMPTVIIERNRKNVKRLYTVVCRNSCELKPRTPSNRSHTKCERKVCGNSCDRLHVYTKKSRKNLLTDSMGCGVSIHKNFCTPRILVGGDPTPPQKTSKRCAECCAKCGPNCCVKRVAQNVAQKCPRAWDSTRPKNFFGIATKMFRGAACPCLGTDHKNDHKNGTLIKKMALLIKERRSHMVSVSADPPVVWSNRARKSCIATRSGIRISMPKNGDLVIGNVCLIR